MSLADLYNAMEANDHEMVKEAEELEKIAAEEEAAGRIMARGFMDELNKLAQELEASKPPRFAGERGKPVKTIPAPPLKVPPLKGKPKAGLGTHKPKAPPVGG
jgi:hypothetical protein